MSKSESKTEETLVFTIPEKNGVFYGADTRGKKWKKVTGPMSYDEAKIWVLESSMTGIYVKNSSWGLYTDNSLDAWRMAWDLGNKCAPIFHGGKEGQFSHYHVNNFIFLERHNHFHLWYGTLN